jgi:hypothetical protein
MRGYSLSCPNWTSLMGASIPAAARVAPWPGFRVENRHAMPAQPQLPCGLQADDAGTHDTDMHRLILLTAA